MAMKLSTDRILTTHVGSLPRSPELVDLLEAQNQGKPHDETKLAALIESSIKQAVAKQIEAGVDVVNDGELGKVGYTHYVGRRLSGFKVMPAKGRFGGSRGTVHKDYLDFPDFAARAGASGQISTSYPTPTAAGPIKYVDRGPLETDLKNLSAATAGKRPTQTFMSSASPGVLDNHLPNVFYKSDDEYLEALAEAMREEYLAIHKAGHVLQIDCPELASARANRYQDETIESFRKIAARAVEVLNHATRDIPPEDMRIHVCWGNYEGPHIHDVPFKDVAEVVFKARPTGILFEGANPRHEHEWEDWTALKIPDDKILIPGVIDTTTNFVEHPQLVAQRLGRYADIVGRERVIGGVDCGFSSSGGKNYRVAPSIVWAKLAALAEGARVATKRLWKK